MRESQREIKIKLDDIIPLVREKLSAGQNVTFSPRGVSMLPTIKEGRDTVTLAPPPQRLRRYDIALYQREGGQYVLHRVVRVGDTYTMMGDNQVVLEYGITHEQIIAVCVSVTRNGRCMDARSFGICWRGVWRYHARLIRRAFRGVKYRCAKLLGKA